MNENHAVVCSGDTASDKDARKAELARQRAARKLAADKQAALYAAEEFRFATLSTAELFAEFEKCALGYAAAVLEIGRGNRPHWRAFAGGSPIVRARAIERAGAYRASANLAAHNWKPSNVVVSTRRQEKNHVCDGRNVLNNSRIERICGTIKDRFPASYVFIIDQGAGIQWSATAFNVFSLELHAAIAALNTAAAPAASPATDSGDDESELA